MTDKASAKDTEAILTEARQRFQHLNEDDATNRREQREDTRFVYADDSQWDDDVRARRKEWGDPCMQFNQLKPFVNQIVNDQRQNRPGIRVHPASGDASKEVADILQGLIRTIEYDSSAEAAYDGGYQHAVVGGRGYWRVCSEYEKGFDQKLMIKRIPDPMTVYMDMDFQEPDAADINYCFVTESLSRDEFTRLYPDADPDSWDTDEYWLPEDKVIVADYYRRVRNKRTLVATSDGGQGYKDEMPELPEGVTVVSERETDDFAVEWYKIAGGAQVLETYEWPGKYIPVICCMGDEIMIDGKRTFQGAIRQAKSAQQMFNYGMNAQAIHLALTPRAPWVAAAGQIENYQDTWNNANRRNYSVLPYEPQSLDGSPVPPPQRQQASMVDGGWLNWTQQQVALLKSTTGIYENSLGMRANETSGRAILAREKQGDNATFHYVDNLSRAIALTGKIIVEVIPDFYDTERIVHIIGTDDTRKMVTLNQNVPNPQNPLEAIKQNDITVGDYAVTVQAGPSYATKRQETADSLMQFIQAFPPAAQVAGDLIAKAMDWPDSDVIADRLKLGLPPQIQQMEAAKAQGQNPQLAQMQQAMQQMQQQMQQMQQAASAKIQELSQENQSLKLDKSNETTKIAAEHDTDQAKVLVDFLKVMMPAIVGMGSAALPAAAAATQEGEQMLPGMGPVQGPPAQMPQIPPPQMQQPPQPPQQMQGPPQGM